MLAYLLTLPDDWTIRLDHLANELRIGRDKTQKIMRELQTTGYAQLRDARDAASGRLGGKRWVIFELANGDGSKPEGERDDLFADSLKTRRPENQVVGSVTDSLKTRQSEKPTVGKSGPIPITKNIPNTNSNLPPNPHAQAPTWAEFEAIWPWSETEPRDAAGAVWKRLGDAAKASALKSVSIFLAAVDEQQHKRPHARTYLRERRWTGLRDRARPAVVAARPRETPQDPARGFFLRIGSEQLKAWQAHELRSNPKFRFAFVRVEGLGQGVWRASEYPPTATGPPD